MQAHSTPCGAGLHPAKRVNEQHWSMSFSDAEQEVLDFLRSEQESYYSGDFDAFVEHWHHGPEVRRVLSGPQVGTRVNTGWEELFTRFKEGFRQYPQSFDAQELLRWDNIQVQVSAEMAWISYDQIALKHIPEMHAVPLSHEIKIVQRFDGAWKLICLMVVIPAIGRDDVPCIELGANGSVINVNALARERLDQHSGLMVSHERLRARSQAYDVDLQKAIELSKKRLATNLPRGFLNEQAIVVLLGEDDAGHPVFCWVAAEQERVLVSFDDAFLLRAKLDRAAASFGLSPAQLNLAELLTTGRDLAAAAEELGVTVNTVRTQVRRMFEKTHTHNQAGLVSRLLNNKGPD